MAGLNTWNVTAVGDLMSFTGSYANFADDTGKLWCPAPFFFVLHDDTNVALVSYGCVSGCGAVVMVVGCWCDKVNVALVSYGCVSGCGAVVMVVGCWLLV